MLCYNDFNYNDLNGNAKDLYTILEINKRYFLNKVN